jgi:outer membrane protein assembly factor BamB
MNSAREPLENDKVTSRQLVLLALAVAASAENWPDFRGPRDDGHSSETNLPLTWNESENVRWKVELPGTGWSTPVIVDNEIWLTTATDGNRSLRALTFDITNGKLRSNVEVFRLTAGVQGHSKNSGASPSALIEGDRVFVHFGSYGTACLRRNGEVVWRNQELKYTQAHGPGGSPVLYEDLLLLNCDGHDTQFVAALDKNTGKVVWRKPRPSAMAYSTPLIVKMPKGAQFVSTGAHRTISYDPRTGTEFWSVSYGDGFSNVPRPVFANGLVFICTGFYQPQVIAIRLDGTVAWRFSRGVPLTPSVIVVDGRLYMVSDNGILTCLDAATGKELWRQRLEGNYSASPIYAEGRIYFLSEEGETTVIAPGGEFKKLAANKLNGRFLASIGVSSGALFLRSNTHLYRIQK